MAEQQYKLAATHQASCPLYFAPAPVLGCRKRIKLFTSARLRPEATTSRPLKCVRTTRSSRRAILLATSFKCLSRESPGLLFRSAATYPARIRNSRSWLQCSASSSGDRDLNSTGKDNGDDDVEGQIRNHQDIQRKERLYMKQKYPWLRQYRKVDDEQASEDFGDGEENFDPDALDDLELLKFVEQWENMENDSGKEESEEEINDFNGMRNAQPGSKSHSTNIGSEESKQEVSKSHLGNVPGLAPSSVDWDMGELARRMEEVKKKQETLNAIRGVRNLIQGQGLGRFTNGESERHGVIEARVIQNRELPVNLPSVWLIRGTWTNPSAYFSLKVQGQSLVLAFEVKADLEQLLVQLQANRQVPDSATLEECDFDIICNYCAQNEISLGYVQKNGVKNLPRMKDMPEETEIEESKPAPSMDQAIAALERIRKEWFAELQDDDFEVEEVEEEEEDEEGETETDAEDINSETCDQEFNYDDAVEIAGENDDDGEDEEGESYLPGYDDQQRC